MRRPQNVFAKALCRASAPLLPAAKQMSGFQQMFVMERNAGLQNRGRPPFCEPASPETAEHLHALEKASAGALTKICMDTQEGICGRSQSIIADVVLSSYCQEPWTRNAFARSSRMLFAAEELGKPLGNP